MTKRILVVEDQEDNRRILRDLLAHAGYDVIEVGDGEQALIAVAEHHPDVILMDIQLPLLDGYEATRRIKADPALKHIPIIVVTSYALSGDEAKARALLRRLCGKALQPPRPARQNSRIRPLKSCRGQDHARSTAHFDRRRQ